MKEYSFINEPEITEIELRSMLYSAGARIERRSYHCMVRHGLKNNETCCDCPDYGNCEPLRMKTAVNTALAVLDGKLEQIKLDGQQQLLF